MSANPSVGALSKFYKVELLRPQQEIYVLQPPMGMSRSSNEFLPNQEQLPPVSSTTTNAHPFTSRGLEAVKYLCSLEEVNVNAMDRYHHTPAYEASQNGYLDVLEFLREQGATTIQGNIGYSLCKAAAFGNISKLEEMLQDGVSLNACDYDGRTAAHLAASNGYFRALKWLVGHGATINVMDRFGNTPLDDAIRERHSEIEQYLRERISPQKTK